MCIGVLVGIIDTQLTKRKYLFGHTALELPFMSNHPFAFAFGSVKSSTSMLGCVVCRN